MKEAIENMTVETRTQNSGKESDFSVNILLKTAAVLLELRSNRSAVHQTGSTKNLKVQVAEYTKTIFQQKCFTVPAFCDCTGPYSC
jgi:hypothetical protein